MGEHTMHMMSIQSVHFNRSESSCNILFQWC